MREGEEEKYFALGSDWEVNADHYQKIRVERYVGEREGEGKEKEGGKKERVREGEEEKYFALGSDWEVNADHYQKLELKGMLGREEERGKKEREERGGGEKKERVGFGN